MSNTAIILPETIRIYAGLAWDFSLTFSNNDGTIYTVPTACKAYIRDGTGLTVTTITGTATQVGLKAVLSWSQTAAECAAVLDIGGYDICFTKTENGQENSAGATTLQVLDSAKNAMG